MSTSPNDESFDMTKIGSKEEKKVSILPPALLAAKALNKKNAIGIQEVQLPILNITVQCSAIANIDEIMIKTISGSMSAYNDANFRLFYKHTEFPVEANINSYEDFISTLTEADFRTILFGIMMASFKTLEENRFVCRNEKCPNPDESRIFTYTPMMNAIKIVFPQAPYVSPSHDHTKDLFIADSGIMKINYRFSTVKHKIDIFRTKSNDEIRQNLIDTGMMLQKTDLTLNYMDSVEVIDDEQKYLISNQDDIKLFINSLDVTSREEIEKLNDRFISHIDGWIPKFKTTVKCPHCSKTQEWEDIDIYVEFFRKFTAIF